MVGVMKPRSFRLVLIKCASLKKCYIDPAVLLTVGSCWTSSAAELPLDMLTVEAPLFAVVGVTGASVPNPESKLGFLAAALPQLFIPRAEDEAAEVGIFPSLFASFILTLSSYI